MDGRQARIGAMEFLQRKLAAGLAFPDTHSKSFFQAHLLWPLLIAVALMLLLIPFRGDLWLADAIYGWEGHAWSLHDNFITQTMLHVQGKRISTEVWYGVAVLLLISLALPWLRRWRMPLLYLLAASALSTGVVGTLKLYTDMDCPWDLVRYGGTYPYVDLFTARAAWLPPGRCFPSGHASAGYAWVSLYFFFLATRPALRWWGLAVGLFVGLLFGAAQQLRGAHFLSHDLATLMICWLVSLVFYVALLARERINVVGPPGLEPGTKGL